MNSLFEMLTAAQNNQRLGQFTGQLANKFGIQQKQVEQALEALMPAFSEGLKRNTATPFGFGAFMQALADGQHVNYFENPLVALSPAGIDEGNAILGHLFGSKNVSRKVAEQAAFASGVPSSILKKMLPALAPMILGGLFKQMTDGGAQSRQAAQSANPFGRILEELMKGSLGGALRGDNQPSSGGNNPIGDILEQMMGKGRMQQQDPRTGQVGTPSSPADNPLGRIFEEMLGQKTTAPNGPLDRYEQQQQADELAKRTDGGHHDDYTSSRPQPDDRVAPTQQPRGGGLEDLFGDLFKPGPSQNPQYEKSIESIFDEFLGRRGG